jgi:hypothetical protein
LAGAVIKVATKGEVEAAIKVATRGEVEAVIKVAIKEVEDEGEVEAADNKTNLTTA